MDPIMVFKATVLATSMLLGIETLPVEPTNNPAVWARLCNTCEPRTYLVSMDTLEYGLLEPDGPKFVAMVAKHEVCHNYLGHTIESIREKIQANDGAVYPVLEQMEEDVQNDCLIAKLGYTEEQIKEMDAAANAWFFGRNSETYVPKLIQRRRGRR